MKTRQKKCCNKNFSAPQSWQTFPIHSPFQYIMLHKWINLQQGEKSFCPPFIDETTFTSAEIMCTLLLHTPTVTGRLKYGTSMKGKKGDGGEK